MPDFITGQRPERGQHPIVGPVYKVLLVRQAFSMNFLKAWFEAPFRLVLLVMDIYKANTGRVAKLMGHGKARRVLNAAILITVASWLVIFVFLGDEHRRDLTNAVRELSPFSDE